MGQDSGLVEAEHPRVFELLGAWALGATDGRETDEVRAHLDGCPVCGAEAARLEQAAAWLGAAEELSPPAGLRDTVLAAARARRRPAPAAQAAPAATAAEATAPYAAAVAELDELLGELAPEQWEARVVHGWRVPELVAHLAANDATLAAELGIAPAAAAEPARPAAARAAWRAQADAVLRLVGGGGAAVLHRSVRLVGPWEPGHPLPQALDQRAFETWIHAEDIRAATGRPAVPPDPGRVGRILALAVRLLPAALALLGLEHPGRTARLVLSGPGGGRWSVPLSPRGGPGEPDVTIGAEAAEFCYLIGNRRSAASLRHTVEGDRALAADLLRAATRLGCD
jgi:uncharacterized protein (TIGR03083 family)